MPEAGGEDNAATFPPEGLTIAEALSILRPAAWSAYDRAERAAAARRKLKFTALTPPPEFEACERATDGLLLELRTFIEHGPYELWGCGSPIEAARRISAS